MKPLTEKKEISSQMTYFYKFVLPYLWIGMILSGLFIGFSSGNVNYYSLSLGLVIILIITFFIFRWSKRLKKVSIDENYLYISDFKNEITIDFTDILKVEQPLLRILNPESILITMKINTIWGKKICFVPKERVLNFLKHPIVNELRKLIVK